jgi:hypothetical protein
VLLATNEDGQRLLARVEERAAVPGWTWVGGESQYRSGWKCLLRELVFSWRRLCLL